VTAVAAPARVSIPYKGLEYYAEDDAAFFFGREREAGIVIGNLLASRLTLLYGPSGVGKSSLLRAGVLPRLHARGDVAAVVFSSWIEPPAPALAAALAAAVGLPQPEPDATLVEVAEDCGRRFGGDLLVVLDQFEEYFVYHPADDGPGSFAQQLPALLRRGDLQVSVLISIREDALARLDRFKGRIPNLFDNYLRVAHLDGASAREAILGPLAQYAKQVPDEQQVGIEPELVDEILDQVETGKVTIGVTGAGAVDGAAAGGRIESPYLQLVLTRLWREESAAGSRVLTRATLRRLGGAGQIVRTHLDDALGKLPVAQQETAAAVFRFLVTPSGTKIAYRVGDLAEYAERPREEVSFVLTALAARETRIVRPVGDDAYEIYHDVLATAILDWRGRYLRSREAAAAARRRRRNTRLLVLGVVVAGAAVGAAFYKQSQKTTEAQNQALLAEARAAPGFAGILRPGEGPLAGADFSPDGRQIVTAAAAGGLTTWRARSRARIENVDSAALTGFRFAAHRDVAVAAGDSPFVWTPATGRTAPLRVGPVEDAAFDPAGTTIATAGADGIVRIVDWKTHRVVRRIYVPDRSAVRSVDWGPAGDRVALAGDDGFALTVSVPSGRVITRVPPLAKAVDVIRYGPAGASLLTAGEDGVARVLTPTAGGGSLRTTELREGRSPLHAAGFSPDGRLVATGGVDGVVCVWDWSARRRTLRFRQPTAVTSLAFSRDGRRLVTTGIDGSARLWSVTRPDLSIRIVGSTLNRRGTALRVVLAVSNVGEADAPRTTADVSFPGLARRVAVPPLRAGARRQVTIGIAVPPHASERTVFVARVDGDFSVVESSYGNNAATSGPVLALPDLALTTVAAGRVGDVVKVTVDVVNRGQAASGATTLAAAGPGLRSGPVAIPALAPHRRIRRVVALHASGPVRSGRIAVTVDPRHSQAEPGYVNNTDYSPVPPPLALIG
jgi:hypothetical protein